MPTLVIAAPDRDFDPTELLAPYLAFRKAGHAVVFATGSGQPAACDPLLLTGVLFGKLGARPEYVAHYRELIETEAWKNPIRYEEVDPARFDALVLPGGHAKGMRSYLEHAGLQQQVVRFFAAKRPVGAICHGGVVLARSIDPATGRSVIHGRRATALTKSLEWSAWVISAWKLGDYYRTYPEWVQAEVSRAQGDPALFETGPLFASYDHPFVVVDQNLVTGRWPGDASRFAETLLKMVEDQLQSG